MLMAAVSFPVLCSVLKSTTCILAVNTASCFLYGMLTSLISERHERLSLLQTHGL